MLLLAHEVVFLVIHQPVGDRDGQGTAAVGERGQRPAAGPVHHVEARHRFFFPCFALADNRMSNSYPAVPATLRACWAGVRFAGPPHGTVAVAGRRWAGDVRVLGGPGEAHRHDERRWRHHEHRHSNAREHHHGDASARRAVAERLEGRSRICVSGSAHSAAKSEKAMHSGMVTALRGSRAASNAPDAMALAQASTGMMPSGTHAAATDPKTSRPRTRCARTVTARRNPGGVNGCRPSWDAISATGTRASRSRNKDRQLSSPKWPKPLAAMPAFNYQTPERRGLSHFRIGRAPCYRLGHSRWSCGCRCDTG